MSAAEIAVAFHGQLNGFTLNAAFRVPAHGITGLFGPSGCGKTSVLRAIAGLARMASGSCEIDGEMWQSTTKFVPPHRRAIGMVFQEASLFAHLNVRRNLLYGAPAAWERATIGFDETVALLGLEALLDRSPKNLSGGERQRVAIGRALLSQPKLLLMDEPLSALDRASKDEILPYLERLHARLAMPMIYVSHDIREIERLADHLVLMEQGSVLATGPIAQLQSNPSLPLAQSHEAAASLDAVVVHYDSQYGLASLQVAGGVFLVPCPALPVGSAHRLHILAVDVSLACEQPLPSTISNSLPAVILDCQSVGEHQLIVQLGLGVDGIGARLLARVTLRSWEMLGLRRGLAVHAQVKSVALLAGG